MEIIILVVVVIMIVVMGVYFLRSQTQPDGSHFTQESPSVEATFVEDGNSDLREQIQAHITETDLTIQPHPRSAYSAELVLLSEGELVFNYARALSNQVAPLTKSKTIIGRDFAGVDVMLPNKTSVSRKHCSIIYDADTEGYYLIDFGSTNGTKVDGQVVPADQRVPLPVNAIIELGTVRHGGARLRFCISERHFYAEDSEIDRVTQPFRNMMVFLSYSRADTEMMQRIYQDLTQSEPLSDLFVWTDEALEVGTLDWQQNIEQAIERSDALIILMSPDAKHSKWVNIELHYAQTQEVQVFPLLVRGEVRDSIPAALINTQHIDMRDDYPTGMNKLIAALENLLEVV